VRSDFIVRPEQFGAAGPEFGTAQDGGA
jgi:hypothetical protein